MLKISTYLFAHGLKHRGHLSVEAWGRAVCPLAPGLSKMHFDVFWLCILKSVISAVTTSGLFGRPLRRSLPISHRCNPVHMASKCLAILRSLDVEFSMVKKHKHGAWHAKKPKLFSGCGSVLQGNASSLSFFERSNANRDTHTHTIWFWTWLKIMHRANSRVLAIEDNTVLLNHVWIQGKIFIEKGGGKVHTSLVIYFYYKFHVCKPCHCYLWPDSVWYCSALKALNPSPKSVSRGLWHPDKMTTHPKPWQGSSGSHALPPFRGASTTCLVKRFSTMFRYNASVCCTVQNVTTYWMYCKHEIHQNQKRHWIHVAAES